MNVGLGRTVTWTGSAEELVWGYRTILMHAVSKEGSNPAIYAQLQGNDEYELLEARFVPEDATKLDDLFAAFSRGACLNPDEPGDDEGAGDFYFDDQEVRMGLDNGDFEEDDEEEGQDSEMANGTN